MGLTTVQNNQQFPSPTCTSTQITNHTVLTPLHEVPPSDLFTVTPNHSALTQAMDISAAFLIQMRGNSCSRGNFAAHLCRQWFSPEERKSSNVRGKNGKKQLNLEKMKSIYHATLQMYPLALGGKREQSVV